VELQTISQLELESVEGGMMSLTEFEAPPQDDAHGGLAYRVNFSYWSGEYVFLP
jgi:hypothetical protein